MEKKRILIIGSLNTDIVLSLKRMPEVGETVLSDSYYFSLGGKGANQACSAGKLGGRVSIIGSVGNDDFGKTQIANLESIGVDCSNVRISEGRRTGMAVVTVDEDGNNSIIVSSSANLDCDISYIEEKKCVIENSDIVLIQLEIPFDAVERAVEIASAAGKIVLLNPAPYSEKITDGLLKKIDYLIPNESELKSLEPDVDIKQLKSIEAGARNLVSRGAKNVIVTLGKEGCLWVNKDEVLKLDVEDVQRVDTTGAGDCFCGAFCVALSEGEAVKDALVFAGKASTLAVTRKGAQDAMPFRTELK